MFKWNKQTKQYEPYHPDWDIKLFSDDMDEIVNCASCGKKVKFGDAFTSMEIHTDLGLGYPVCGECHNKESE